MLDTKTENKWPLIDSRAIKGHLIFIDKQMRGEAPLFLLQKNPFVRLWLNHGISTENMVRYECKQK